MSSARPNIPVTTTMKTLRFELPRDLEYLVLDGEDVVSWTRSRTSFEHKMEPDDLTNRLLAIEGVDSVQSHFMFGPYVYVTVCVPFRGVRKIRACILKTHKDILVARAERAREEQEE